MAAFGRSARRVIAAALLAALAGSATSAGIGPSRSEAAGPACDYLNGLGSFRAGNWPTQCWRPYANSSPFNRRIPAGAPLRGSRRMVMRLLAGGPANPLVFGDPDRDYGVPVYWSQPGDPFYDLHCTEPWGRCAIEGMRVRVPAEAQPAGGVSTPANEHDAHLTVVDQASGWEYDLWNVQSKPAGGGTLRFGWGGRTRIDGDGLGSDAVAARYGSLAGIIRAPELRAGSINHALLMDVPCTETYVYPATKAGLLCSQAGMRVAGALPMGAHLRLALSRKSIRRLRVPRWKRAILTALARYGAYVSDTTGAADQWGFEAESSATYASFGAPSPVTALAGSLGLRPADFNDNGHPEYWFDVARGVPWKRLRVVGVCAALGSC
jgi:hypothetical protein